MDESNCTGTLGPATPLSIRVSILETPELSLALTATVGDRPLLPLTHLPLTNGPLSEIDGGRGSSIVTSTERVWIVAPGAQLLAPQ